MVHNWQYLEFCKFLLDWKRGDLVGIYTQKGEAVALAEAIMNEEEIVDAIKGYAFETKRIIMAPNTYPKSWRSKGRIKIKNKEEESD